MEISQENLYVDIGVTKLLSLSPLQRPLCAVGRLGRGKNNALALVTTQI